jgi:hypothetical protein
MFQVLAEVMVGLIPHKLWLVAFGMVPLAFMGYLIVN